MHHACFARNASHHLRLGFVLAMQGPGLGDGSFELVGDDVVDAHGRAYAIVKERYALLTVAVFNGVRKTLIFPWFYRVTQGTGAVEGIRKPRVETQRTRFGRRARSWCGTKGGGIVLSRSEFSSLPRTTAVGSSSYRQSQDV